MSSKNRLIILVMGALLLIFSGSPFFVVNEYEQAVITQFGKPIGTAKKKAGLYLKIPFIQKITYFDKRLLEWDGDPSEIPTKDKKYIWVDTIARWKISNPLRFYQSVYNERGGHAKLDNIIGSAVMDLVTSHNLVEIVRSSNRLLEENIISKKGFVEKEALEKIKKGREKLRQAILKQAKELVPQYGIDLVDVRIKRVNYVEEVRRKVYDRMVSERMRAAEQYRSEGKGKKEEIEGQTNKELKTILSLAYKDAQKIKGKADKKATGIYAGAYSKNPEFFVFMKSLDAYSESLNKDSRIILTTDSDYFKYLKSLRPGLNR